MDGPGGETRGIYKILQKMDTTIQYILIALLFAGAVYYLYGRFFGKKQKRGCGKGCDCPVSQEAGR